MGTTHSEAAFFIFQNSIGTYLLIDKKQTKYHERYCFKVTLLYYFQNLSWLLSSNVDIKSTKVRDGLSY